jgi:hypothetical protein
MGSLLHSRRPHRSTHHFSLGGIVLTLASFYQIGRETGPKDGDLMVRRCFAFGRALRRTSVTPVAVLDDRDTRI